MRIFQLTDIYRGYLARALSLTRDATLFADKIEVLLKDRYCAVHVLQPVRSRDPTAFFTFSNHVELQRTWAGEQGMPATTALSDILLAQIEHHRTEILYNQDPTSFGNAFLKRLPGSVKRTVAWWAAPTRATDFYHHDVIVNNFPTLLDGYRRDGLRAEYFAPAHDPVMDVYAAHQDRPIDVVFVGGYSRHHGRRARTLEAVAALGERHQIRLCLDVSRFTRLAETPVGMIGPLNRYRRSAALRAVSAPAVFGVDLYEKIGRAKIVINGAVDMGGNDRGNMRCWEAMGCGAALVSDAGVYPAGMVAGETLLTYHTIDEMLGAIEQLLADGAHRQALAARAHKMIGTTYEGGSQWRKFKSIVE